MKPFLRLLTLILSVSTAGLIWAQQDQPATGSQAPADNTKTNQRDRNPGEPTADQQKENGSDRALAQQVRRALVKDKSLSTYAHNIKIISRDGRVTLKGPVRSEEEKTAIESKATEIAGAGNVTNELEVAPPKS